MKLLLLVVSLTFSSISAQTYSQLVDTSKIWSTYNWGWPYGYNIKSDYTRFTGDTLIGGVHFHKVIQAQDSMHQNWTGIGYIREDSTKKVFYRALQATTDRLLYNFALQVGDTFQVLSIQVVDTVDSVMMFNHYVKRIVLSYPPYGVTETWYEGIGSNGGLLFPGQGLVVGGSHHLLCCWKNDTLIYHSPGYNFCYFTYTGIDDPVKTETRVVISPDPVVSQSELRLMTDGSGEFMIEIFTIHGVRVKTLEISKNKTISLRKSDFSEGMYLYKIRLDNSKKISGKFIVL